MALVKEWQCSKCTLIQTMKNAKCSACGAKNTIKSKINPKTSKKKVKDQPKGSKKKKKVETKEDKEDIPQTAKPPSPHDSDDDVIKDLDIDINKLNEDEKMLEETDDNGWQCFQCTYIQPSTNETCELCGYSRTAAKGKNEKKKDKDNWMEMKSDVFYGIVTEICDSIPDHMNKNFNKFVLKLNEIGIQSDDALSRALNIGLTYSLTQKQNKMIGKGNAMATPAKIVDNMINDPNYGQLKKWMRKNNFWDKDLYIVLIDHSIVNIPDDLFKIKNYFQFQNLITKVKVMRRTDLKTNDSKMRLERLLVKFEKEWMKQTGFKKTSIKDSYK